MELRHAQEILPGSVCVRVRVCVRGAGHGGMEELWDGGMEGWRDGGMREQHLCSLHSLEPARMSLAGMLSMTLANKYWLLSLAADLSRDLKFHNNRASHGPKEGFRSGPVPLQGNDHMLCNS